MIPLKYKNTKRRWTKQELNYLKKNYGKIPITRFKLNRSEVSIKLKGARYGLRSNLRGLKKGETNVTSFKKLNKHPYWKGGCSTTYRKINRIKLGLSINTKLIIHHKDGNHFNNNIKNLQIMTLSEHVKYHNEHRRDK